MINKKKLTSQFKKLMKVSTVSHDTNLSIVNNILSAGKISPRERKALEEGVKSMSPKQLDSFIKSINRGKARPQKKDNNKKTSVAKNKEKAQDQWIPKLEDSNFEYTFLFVLRSIYENEEINISKNTYALSVRQARAQYLHFIQHHGITGGTNKWKQLCQYVVLLAEGRNPEPLTLVATIPGDIPLPKKLDKLLPILQHIKSKGDDWRKSYQALITILSLGRLSKEIPELDLSQIITPANRNNKLYKKYLEGFRLFCKQHKALNISKPIDLSAGVKPRMRLTSGPNKNVTLASSVKEAILLLNHKILGKSFERFCRGLNLLNLFHYIKRLSDENIESEDTSETYLGRLALVPDSQNKHRLVAMVDYWTNLVLAPVEELIRSLLKEHFHFTDFLRNHEEGSSKVQKFEGPSWSIDLSSWTDRFPIDLQQIVVECLLGSNLGQDWMILMKARDFWIPGLKKYVRYEVGQPMGSKGSFAIASLTHHMFIHYSYERVKTRVPEKQIKPLKDLYAIVGDDLVVFDKDLHDQVLEDYKILDVKVQILKSKIPVDENYFTEFCSRTSINNVDVSLIPPNLIRNSSNNWRDFPSLFIQMEKRGVRPKVTLLHEIPFLKVVRKSGQPYLYNLAQMCLLPLMGKDMSELGKEIWPDVKLPIDRNRAICYNALVQVCRTCEKLDDSIEEYTRTLNLKIEDYESIEKIDFPDVEDIPGQEHPANHCWSLNGHIFKLACKEQFMVKGWKGKIPHPASIAAAYLAYTTSTIGFRGFPGLDIDSCESLDSQIIEWTKDMGRMIASVVPKGAEDLIPTAGNQNVDFLRYQISGYTKIINGLSLPDPCLTITKWNLKIKLSNGDSDNLGGDLVSSVEDWGKSPHSSRIFIKSLLGELRFPLVEEDVPSFIITDDEVSESTGPSTPNE